MGLVIVVLNFLSLVCLCLAVYFAIQRKIKLHQIFIGVGVLQSLLLLIVFLYDKFFLSGLTLLPKGESSIGFLVFLGSHILASVIVLPMIGLTIRLALHKRWDRHKRWARWTAPVWFYSSVTGIYLYMGI